MLLQPTTRDVTQIVDTVSR